MKVIIFLSLLIFVAGCHVKRMESCINRQLTAMAKADHVTSWSPELYKAVVETCKELLKSERELHRAT